MKTNINNIGNSHEVPLAKQLHQQHDLQQRAEIIPEKDHRFQKALKPHSRSGWREQFEQALKDGHQPDGELLEGF